MKKFIVGIVGMLLMVFLTACSGGSGGGGAKIFDINLTSSDTEIIADGVESIEFSLIMFDEEGNKIENKQATLYCDGEKVDSLEFSSTTIGTHSFYVICDDVKSNEIEITVNKVPSEASKLVIVSDKDSILANDIEVVTISVNVYDQYDEKMEELNEDVDVYINGKKVYSLEFSTMEVGDFEVVAKYNNITSNTLTIEAEFDPIRVASVSVFADDLTITADGTEISTFTTRAYDQYGNQLEDQSIKIYVDEVELEGAEFSTLTVGEYTVYAECEGVKSDELIITAEHMTYEGDFTVTSDMSQEYLDSIGRITGTLYVEDEISHLTMNNLKEVEEGVYIIENYNLEEINLPNLENLGKTDFSVWDDDFFGNYDSHYFSLRVSECYGLSELELPKLKILESEMLISDNVELSSIVFNSLENAQEIRICGNYLSVIEMEKLETISDHIFIYGEDQLQTIDLPTVTSISGATFIYENSNLKNIKMNSLVSTENELTIFDNSNLETIEFKVLQSIKDSLYLSDLSALLTLDISSLESISDSDELYYHDESYNRHYLSIEINNCNSIQEVNADSLLSTDGGIYLTENINLKSFNAPLLEGLGGSLIINNNALEEINMASCKNIDDRLWINNETNLKLIEIPNITVITGYTMIYNNESLEEIKINRLNNAKSAIQIYDNAKLRNIEFSNLQTIDDIFKILNLPELVTVNLSNLRTIKNSDGFRVLDNNYNYHYFSLEFQNCGKLESLEFPKVTSLSGGVYFKENSALISVDFPVLSTSGGTPWFQDNAIQRLFFPELVDVKSLFIYNESKLTEIEMPELKSCEEDINIHSNEMLSNISMENLNSIGDDFYVSFTVSGEIDLADNVQILGDYTLENGIQK